MAVRENPKLMLLLIAAGIAGSTYLGLQLWQGSPWDLTGIARRQLTAQSGDVLNRFEVKPDDGALTAKKTAPVMLSEYTGNSLTNGSRNGAVMYYRRSNGFVDEVYAPDKSLRPVSEAPLRGFLRALWSPDKQSVIALYAGGNEVEFKHFSYLTKKVTSLPANTKSVAYSPSGDQIVYFATTGDLGGVYLAFPDGKSSKKIFETRISEMELFWPSEKDIYFLTKNQSVGTWDLLLITGEGTMKTVLSDQRGFEMMWSRDGKKLLYSSFPDDLGLSLMILDTASGISVPASVYARASHCVWSVDSKTYYCGVQTKRPTYQDYFAGVMGNESIVKVTMEDGKSETIFDVEKSDMDLGVLQAVLSPLEDYLFFVNYFDGLIYSFEL